MHQSAIDAFTESTRRDLFAALGIDQDDVIDLGGFESFVFQRKDRDTVLRVTHKSHRSLVQVMAELEWIDFLARRGAAVCTPVRTRNGELAFEWREFVVSEFRRAPGRTIVAQDWRAPLFREWGRRIGELHRLAAEFVPADPESRRPDWTQDDNFALAARIPRDEEGVIARADEYVQRLHGLATGDADYGLIHCDAHPGNFFVDGGKLTFFDFDDSCYCWFAYDVATILFSAVLQPWIGNSQQAREAAARSFLPEFLEGYAGEAAVTDFMLAQMPLFLKVRELSLYGVICSFLVAGDFNWYETKFMNGRRERIERDAPYLKGVGGNTF